jgi:hypothetical protein
MLTDRLFTHLHNKRKRIEGELFTNPPADYCGVMQIIARHAEITELMAELERVMKGIEDDE